MGVAVMREGRTARAVRRVVVVSCIFCFWICRMSVCRCCKVTSIID